MNGRNIRTKDERLPALGRRYTLGQLYDCRTETVVKNKILWSKDTMSKVLTVHPHRNTVHEVLMDQTHEKKIHRFRISSRLQTSIATKLVSLQGSSQYLNDHESDQYDKVTLHYKCTTKFEELDIDKISKEMILCPDVFTDGIGTHVVSGIIYGGEAFFVFDNCLSSGYQKSKAGLYRVVKSLTQFTFDSSGRLAAPEEMSDQTTDKIRCRLYSDFRTPYQPRGYKDAAKLFSSFSHFVEGRGTHALPIVVLLYPLSELDSFAARIVRHISPSVASQLEIVHNHFDKLVEDCIYMSGMPVTSKFPGMKKDIDNFIQLLKSYERLFQKQAGSLVTRVRSGSSEETDVETLLREKEKSPFGQKQLDTWLQQKNVHLQILRQGDSLSQENLSEYSINCQALSPKTHAFHTESLKSVSSASKLYQEPSPGNEQCYESDLLVCFHVNMGGEKSLTKKMNSYLQHYEIGFLRKSAVAYHCDNDFAHALEQAKQFTEFVEANRFNDRLKFKLVEENKLNGKPDVFVSVRKGEDVLYEEYQPPTAPGSPTLVKSAHDKVRVTWSTPEFGKGSVRHYELQYKEVTGATSQSVQVNGKTSKMTYTITDLALGRDYETQVRAVCDIGVSKWSSWSTMRTLPATAPGAPVASHKIPSDICVRWTKPQQVATTSRLEGYIISVSDVTTGEKFSKKSDPRNGEEIIFSDLKPTSTYTFTVKALFDIGETEESETSGVLEPKPNTIMKGKLLSDSKKVRKGNPAIHRLRIKETLKKGKDKIRKCELGQSKIDAATEKVIMVVGATGAGKTTLINGLVNYVLGVDWKDTFRFQLIVDNDEAEQRSQAQSQTRWITSYTLHHEEGFQVPYSLTVIDTPGFGDTSGIKRDQEITHQIRNFFTTQGDEGIDHIDAIGFVTQASLPRLTPTQRFIFDQVLALFGKDISENIFLLVTFADGQRPPVLEGVKVADIPYKKYFKFNNSALYAQHELHNCQRSKGNTPNSDSDDDGFDQMFWEMGEKSFHTFFKNLNSTEAKSLVLTKDVLNERLRLETHVSGIHQHIRTGLNKLEQLRIEVDVLKRHETDIEMNKDFTYTITEEAVKTEQIPSGTYITNCLNCNFTCHYPCYIPDDAEKRGCAAMNHSEGICMVCPARCVWNVHKNMTYKFVIESITKTKTAEELKARYEDASGKKLTAEELVKKVIDDFESVQLKVLFYTDEVRKSLGRLKEIALKPNPLSTVEYIDILIMSEESQRLPGWKDRRQQLEDVRKQAETLQLLAKPGFDPFEEYKKTYFDMRKKGEKEETIYQTVKKMFKSFLH